MQTPTEFPTTRSYPSIAQSMGIAGMIIALMLLFIPIYIILHNILPREVSTLLYYLFTIGTCFGVVYAIRRKKTGERTFAFHIDHPRIAMLIIIATLALIFGLISPLSTLIPVPDFFKEVIRNLIPSSDIFTFANIVIAAPILEELIFRGIMLEGLLRRYSPAKAIRVSSILFGFIHLNPWQFITGLIIGIFSGWIYYKTRSLLPSIIIHAATNLTAFIMAQFINIDKSFDNTVFNMYGNTTNLIAIVLGCFVILWVCISLLRKHFEHDQEQAQARTP